MLGLFVCNAELEPCTDINQPLNYRIVAGDPNDNVLGADLVQHKSKGFPYVYQMPKKLFSNINQSHILK